MGQKSDHEDKTCFLCDRPLGRRVERHHAIPRLKGGKNTVLVHPICHRTIHATFTEAELAKTYHTRESLMSHPEIAAFVKWIAKRPPDFHAKTLKPVRRRK